MDNRQALVIIGLCHYQLKDCLLTLLLPLIAHNMSPMHGAVQIESPFARHSLYIRWPKTTDRGCWWREVSFGQWEVSSLWRFRIGLLARLLKHAEPVLRLANSQRLLLIRRSPLRTVGRKDGGPEGGRVRVLSYQRELGLGFLTSANHSEQRQNEFS